ncbi:hypothetical protein KKG52_03730 [Patescibacteria group bacterium]|nr:hypothetical protein [Patescibacteria group bacterium]
MKKFCLFFLVFFISLLIFPRITLAEKQVDYDLPYPGLLPDSPFYFLKTSRDNFLDFFINDPIRKAEFNILRADKSLKAVLILYEKGENEKELAENVISKSEAFYKEALKKLEEANKQNLEIGAVVNKLKMSLLKQEEILKSLTKESDEDLKITQDLIKKVDRIFPQS